MSPHNKKVFVFLTSMMIVIFLLLAGSLLAETDDLPNENSPNTVSTQLIQTDYANFSAGTNAEGNPLTTTPVDLDPVGWGTCEERSDNGAQACGSGTRTPYPLMVQLKNKLRGGVSQPAVKIEAEEDKKSKISIGYGGAVITPDASGTPHIYPAWPLEEVGHTLKQEVMLWPGMGNYWQRIEFRRTSQGDVATLWLSDEGIQLRFVAYASSQCGVTPVPTMQYFDLGAPLVDNEWNPVVVKFKKVDNNKYKVIVSTFAPNDAGPTGTPTVRFKSGSSSSQPYLCNFSTGDSFRDQIGNLDIGDESQGNGPNDGYGKIWYDSTHAWLIIPQ